MGWDQTQVTTAVSGTRDPDSLLRLSAQAEKRAIPGLERIVQTESLDKRRYWHARAALAKLGDQQSFVDLERQFHKNPHADLYISLMEVVGDRRVFTSLMSYFLQHQDYHSRVVDHGDYQSDPLASITRVLSSLASQSPGATFAPAGQEEVQEWVTWWGQHSDDPSPPAPSGLVTDPYLKCLARQAEWGFPGAVLLLADNGGASAVPALQRLSLIGPKDRPAPYGSIRGNAQAALAKLGPASEYDRLVDGFITSKEWHVIKKLTYVGGERFADALIRVLPLVPARVEFYRSTPERFNEDLAEYRGEIMRTLAELIVNPPLTKDAEPNDSNVQAWVSWWGKHKATASFRNLYVPPDERQWQRQRFESPQ